MPLARRARQYHPRETCMFSRRDGLRLTLGLAASLAAGARPGLFAPARAAEPVFKVPPLGYGYDALEPYIDTLTMTIHHDKHHGAYVAALNGLVEKYPGLATTSPVAILTDLTVVPEAVRAPVRNNLGGYWNHSFFWELMTPGGAKEPGGDLKELCGNLGDDGLRKAVIGVGDQTDPNFHRRTIRHERK